MYNSTVNYHQIFKDILRNKYPAKEQEFLPMLQKENLSAVDILKINEKIFGSNEGNRISNQRHRSYSKFDILKILDFQKKHHLNNSQLAQHFGISRNTIAKWRKTFVV